MRLFLLAALLIAPVAQARNLEVGAGKEFKEPSGAIAAARDGDHVVIQPGEYFDCAFVRANKLTIEGVGGADKVLITDKACGGQGAAGDQRRRHDDPRPDVDALAGAGRQRRRDPARGRQPHHRGHARSSTTRTASWRRPRARPRSSSAAACSTATATARTPAGARTASTPTTWRCCGSRHPPSRTPSRATTSSRGRSGPRSSAAPSRTGTRGPPAT